MKTLTYSYLKQVSFRNLNPNQWPHGCPQFQTTNKLIEFYISRHDFLFIFIKPL